MDSVLRINKTKTKFYASYPDNKKILLRGQKASFRDLILYITDTGTVIESTTGKKLPIKSDSLENFLIINYNTILNKINNSAKIDTAIEDTLENFYK